LITQPKVLAIQFTYKKFATLSGFSCERSVALQGDIADPNDLVLDDGIPCSYEGATEKCLNLEDFIFESEYEAESSSEEDEFIRTEYRLLTMVQGTSSKFDCLLNINTTEN
jgi:hypothetical protein